MAKPVSELTDIGLWNTWRETERFAEDGSNPAAVEHYKALTSEVYKRACLPGLIQRRLDTLKDTPPEGQREE